ncbi:MAG: hypothetical protein ACLQBY_07505 [Solirubrobacteraceae bacterium]
MTDHSLTSHPPDICLILRAHGEQLWLTAEVVPIVRQLEQPGAIPEDQVGAALAYLEILWLDASARAADTDAARAELERARAEHDGVLCEKARRYHAAVRRLRTAVAQRVAALTGVRDHEHEHAPAREPIADRYANS